MREQRNSNKPSERLAQEAFEFGGIFQELPSTEVSMLKNVIVEQESRFKLEQLPT